MRVPRGFRYQSIEEKLLFNTEIPVGGGCWLWVGKMSNNGYGEFYWKGKYTSAHRAFYKHFINSNIDGLDIDHLCRNPRCVNPEHLEPVSSRENTLRGVSPPAINVNKTHCKRGHKFTEVNTVIDIKGGRSCRNCKLASWRRYYYKRKTEKAGKRSIFTNLHI